MTIYKIIETHRIPPSPMWEVFRQASDNPNDLVHVSGPHETKSAAEAARSAAWDRLYSDPEHDPIASLEWLADEADEYVDNPLSPAWGNVLRMAKAALEKETASQTTVTHLSGRIKEPTYSTNSETETT